MTQNPAASALPSIPPEDKDWTWVLERRCAECGFDATRVNFDQVGPLAAQTTPVWVAALAGPGVARRPEPRVWSVLEYGAHVRDVHRVMATRLALLLDEQDPSFANWDQDATAVEDGYASQDPVTVAVELALAADEFQAQWKRASPEDLARTGRRSNGSTFTVETLSVYYLHDIVHHLADIGWGGESGRRRATIAAYQSAATAYTVATSAMPDRVRAAIDEFSHALGAGARVLEIGSGSGRDALALEQNGLLVRRTDVTPGFVDLLIASGHRAQVLDQLTDDLTDPDGDHDAVWANASLLHIERDDLVTVLGRLASVVRSEGLLRISMKQGVGAGWSRHGAVGAARHFTYWLPDELAAVATAAGWAVTGLRSDLAGKDADKWIELSAVKP